MNVKRIIEESDTPGGRRFDAVVLTLIVISLISFSIETLPALSPGGRTLLGYVERITVVLFTIEYLSRIAVADSRIRYISSFFGVVDLLAILPFYLALGVDLRSVRALRLLRLFRLLKLARYSRAVHRLHRALLIAKEELVLFAEIAVTLIFLSAVGIYYFETAAQPERFASVFHSLWWAVVTLTTVGYGDVYPVTAGGRAFTFLVLMLGLGVVAFPTGLIASALSQARQEEREEGRADGGAPPGRAGP